MTVQLLLVCVCVCVVQPHLFEQRQDVNREEAHGGGQDEARLLQVRHVALVGARQIHHRVHQRVTSVRQAGRYRPVDRWNTSGNTMKPQFSTAQRSLFIMFMLQTHPCWLTDT